MKFFIEIITEITHEFGASLEMVILWVVSKDFSSFILMHNYLD
jgi:hypothetical protein